MIEYFTTAALTYPTIDPILVQIGPLAIRWYSLAYLGGLGLGWFYMLRIIKLRGAPCNATQVGDFIFWAMMGVILGGRTGSMLFYNFDQFAQNPTQIFMIWEGGMSFHGGLIGVALAMIFFCRKRKIPLLRFTDVVSCAVPIGLFLGRIANFVNGELFGRITDSPLGMIFPRGGPFPRHPSQLYEATLEGLVLFIILWITCYHTSARKKPGLITGIFLLGYAAARTTIEQFREPDAHIGFILGTGSLTMGQLLSAPMIILGLYLIFRARKTSL